MQCVMSKEEARDDSTLSHRNMAWHDSATGPALRYQLLGDSGASVVLLHELGGSLESWDEVAPGLARRMRVLRYDQRGQGGSEKVRARFGIAEHVSDLEAVLQTSGLPAPYWVVGAAASCAIAVAYALREPGKVAGLMLCAPALTTDASRQDYLAQRADLAVREGMRAIIDPTLDRSFPVALRGDGRVFDNYRSRLLCSDPVGYAYANLALAESRLREELPRLACPCLLLGGRSDVMRPVPYVRELAAEIPGAHMEEIDSGHLMAVQVPGIIQDRLIAFIAAGGQA
jgi:3-oxoadipate enol-lactonase